VAAIRSTTASNVDDLEDGLDRLIGCDHRTVVNPYHES
jgi:hypothetical protein